MNESLIKNWNKVVKREDRVFMMGDFALCGKDKIIEIGNRLNGRKIIILGNHDGASLNTYYQAEFEMISRFPILFKGSYILSHEPIYVSDSYINIHAHIHDREVSDKKHFCVSVEQIDYKPIEFNEILEQIYWRNVL
jgi:calcineurin-like phosphoesterase family protein